MKSSQRGRSSSPLIIDDSILRRLQRLLDGLSAKNANAILARKGITRDQLDGEYDLLNPLAYRVSTAIEDIREAGTVSITVTSFGDSSITIDSFDSLREFLEDESSDIKELSIRSGGYRETTISISFDNDRLLSAWYRLEGDREVIGNIHHEIQRIIKDASASFSILYGYIPTTIIRIGAGIATFFAYIYLVSLLKAHVSSPVYEASLGFWGFPIGFVVFWGASPLIKFYKEAYPTCLFEFGVQKRRAAAKKQAIALLITAIIVPVFLAYIGLT